MDVGAAYSYGWKKFSENIGQFLALMLAAVVMTLATLIASGYFGARAGFTTESGQVILNRISFGSLLWNIAIEMIAAAILLAFWAALLRAALAATKGIALTPAHYITTTNIGPYAITAAITFLIPNIIVSVVDWANNSFTLLVLGIEVCWIVATFYAPLIALDRGASPSEAISQSLTWVRDNIGQVLLMVLAGIALGTVTLCTFGLAVFVTLPLTVVAVTYTYRALNNELVVP